MGIDARPDYRNKGEVTSDMVHLVHEGTLDPGSCCKSCFPIWELRSIVEADQNLLFSASFLLHFPLAAQGSSLIRSYF